MPKEKSVFVCRECGQEYPKWNGKCLSCGAWNSLEETLPVTSVGAKSVSNAVELKFTRMDEVTFDNEIRYDTGISELDRVLGGGLVKGSLVLIFGNRADNAFTAVV